MQSMTFEEIKNSIHRYKKEGKKIFATSSFQTHSLPLLHILSRIDNSIPIYFNNTGFHFPETLDFRDHIGELFDLNIVDTKPLVPKNQQRDSDGKLFFASDPEYCCYLNKIQPLEPVLMQHDIWINGIRADQNSNRASMNVEQNAPFNSVRYHPMLDWNIKEIYKYKKEHNLPDNPLEAKGYFSIGCEPCTIKFNVEEGRDGRWYGMNKTECGLHTELVSK